MILANYLKGLFNLNVKIFLILLLIFFFLELIERSGFLRRGYKSLARFLRLLGFLEAASAPLFAGLLFGIIYGAGVIKDLVERERIEKKQVFLVSVFLSLCHAIFEDTGLFFALGANLFWLTIPRLILASIITFLFSRLPIKF